MVYKALDYAERASEPSTHPHRWELGNNFMEPEVLPPMKTPIAELRDAFNYRAIVGHPVGENAFCRPGSVGTGQKLVEADSFKNLGQGC